MKNLYTILLLTTINFCLNQNTSAMVVDSLELPIAEFDAFEFTLCQPQKLTIYNQSSYSDQYFWEIEGNHELFILPSKNINVTFFEEGTFDVTLIAVNECGSDTLKKEDFITVYEAVEGEITTSYMGYECGIGEKYLFCVESENETLSYSWLASCLSGDNTGECCEVGFTHGLVSYSTGVYLESPNGCTGYAQGGEVYGDWEYVQIPWGPVTLFFCQGDSPSIPNGVLSCYPPGCTESYGDIDTSVPGVYTIPAKAYYRTCVETTHITAAVIDYSEFKESHAAICIDENLQLETTDPFASLGISYPLQRFEVYVNGEYYGNTPNFRAFEAGTYEVSIVKEYEGFHNSTKCLASNTLTVDVLPSPSVNLEYEEKICRNNTEIIVVEAHLSGLSSSFVSSYLWNINGNVIEVDTNVLTLLVSDLPDVENFVTLSIIDNNGCSSQEQKADFTIDLCNNIKENPLSQLFIHQIALNQLLLQAENMPIGDFHISLYDLAGRKILQQNFFNSYSTLQKTILLQKTNSGIYILQLQGENGTRWQQKIWIE